MLRHVVMFRWAEGVEPSHEADVHAGLDELADSIEVIRSYVHGPDAGVSTGTFDYVVVADFDSAEDFLAYRDHPLHQAFIARLITGKVGERAAVQYEVPA
jgi:hypothetical protein